MNETETPLTVGATEGTGDRPKAKKKAPVKTGAGLKKKGGATKKSSTAGRKAGKKTAAKKAPSSGKPGKSSGSKKTGKAGGKAGGSKKPGKSAAGSAKVSRKSASSAVPIDTSKLTAHGDYGIARIDQPEKSNHGWYVRMGTGDGKLLRFFGDKKFGGKAKAKAAAVEFRNESYAGLPDNLKLRGSKPSKKRAKRAA